MTKKKIITIVFALVLLISVIGATYAYFATYQEGSSANLTVETGELRLVLEDGTDEHGIISGEIDANHKKLVAYLSIENRGLQDTFAKLFFKDLINTFSSDLVYTLDQIESIPSNGENTKVIKRFVFQSPVPSSISQSREELADGLLIKAGTKNGKEVTSNIQYYKVTIEYLYSDTKNQDVDFGKTFYTGFDIEEGDRFLSSVMDLTYNIEDLVDLAKEVNFGDSKSGKEYRLMRNLDFNDDDSYLNPTTIEYGDINKNGIVEGLKTELTTGSGWIPIGTEANPYSGTFNGQGYEIQHLYINNNDTSVTNVGLFGAANNATIRNLGMRDENITSSVSSNIGGIIGIANNSKLENSYNLVTIQNDNIYNIKHNLYENGVGGLVGFSESGRVIINNCYNESNISGGNSVGGIAGCVSNNMDIINSYNKGNISISSANTINAAGAIGYVHSSVISINNFNNYGNIIYSKNSNTSSTFDITIGGVIARLNNSNLTINESGNYGNVSNGSIVGGIIGQLDANTNAVMDKTYNLGKISNITPYADNTYGRNEQSGLVNSTCGNNNIVYILNSYNLGEINNLTSTRSSYKAGGISVGACLNAKMHIINSYNNSKVSGRYAGGIFAYNTSIISLNNIYNNGTITGSEAYSIGMNTGTSSFSNTYYNNANSASNKNINATGMNLSQIQSTSFVTTLNNNLGSITLPNDLSGYTLSTWCTSDNGPVLDYQVPESERSTRCPAYNN